MNGMKIIGTTNHTSASVAMASALLGFCVPTTASATTYIGATTTTSSTPSYNFRESTPQWKRFIEWGALRARLTSWGELPAGWDGEDGIAPDKRTVNAALAFMHSAREASLPLPTPYIAGDGEIGLRWAKGDAFASVAFLGDGEMVIFIRDADGTPFELVQGIEEACPKELIRGLAVFA
jgi:hypothetical protein